MKKMLTCGLLALMLTVQGCSTINGNATNAISSAVTLKYHYETGEVVNFLGNAELTDKELKTVVDALTIADSVKQELKFIEDNPELILTNLSEVNIKYLKLKEAYSDVYQIVLDNKDEYTPVELSTFRDFHESAVILDNQISELMEKAEAMTTVRSLIQLGDFVFKLAAIL